jgi:hypothetical protein
MKEKEQKKKAKLNISKGTIIAILIIIALFAVWNFILMPKIFETKKVHMPAEIPTVKRGNITFINEEIQKRQMTVPTLIAPENTLGKPNPFE